MTIDLSYESFTFSERYCDNVKRKQELFNIFPPVTYTLIAMLLADSCLLQNNSQDGGCNAALHNASLSLPYLGTWQTNNCSMYSSSVSARMNQRMFSLFERMLGFPSKLLSAGFPLLLDDFG